MDKDLSLKINHSVFYDKSQTDNTMAKYRKHDYLESIKEYKSRVGFRRYDGTMSEFICNRKVNSDFKLPGRYYSISLSGDITNYFMKKDYVSKYKNHLFHILDLNKDAMPMFENRVMLYIDGYCIRDAYLLCRSTNTYLFLDPNDFDSGVLEGLITDDVSFTILFLPFSRYFESVKSPTIKYPTSTADYYIDKNAFTVYDKGVDVSSMKDSLLTGVSSHIEVFDYGTSKRKNMFVSKHAHYENYNATGYITNSEFLNTIRKSTVDSKLSFMIDTGFDLARYNWMKVKDVFKDNLSGESNYEGSQIPEIVPVSGYITINANNEYIDITHLPIDINIDPNQYALFYLRVIDCNFDKDTELYFNEKCNYVKSFTLPSVKIRTSQIIGRNIDNEYSGDNAFSIRSSEKVTGSITIDFKLCPYDNSIDRYPYYPVTNNTAYFYLDKKLVQVDPSNILVYKMNNKDGEREKVFLHDVVIERKYPNCYIVSNIPDDVEYIFVSIVGGDVLYPNYHNCINMYMTHIGDDTYLNSLIENTLPELLTNYQPKKLYYSIDDYGKNPVYDKNDEGYEKYQFDKLIEYLPINEDLYKEYLEKCYRKQMHNVVKTMYVDLTSDEWSYIYDRATRTTYKYDSSGNVKDPDLMKKTNVTFSEDMIYIKLSDSDNLANTFCVWIDGLRYYNSRIFMEEFSTWIFIPKRLIKSDTTIEIEMFFFDNFAKNLLVFDTIDTQITMKNPDNLEYQDPYPSLNDIGNGIKDVVDGDRIFRYVKTSNLRKGNWIIIDEGCNSNTLLFYNSNALPNFNSLLDSSTIVSEYFNTTKDILTFNDENNITGICGDKFGNWSSTDATINAIVSKYNFGSTNTGLFVRVNKSSLADSSVLAFTEFIADNNITVSYGTNSPILDTLYYEKCQFSKIIPANLVFIDIDNETLIDNSNFTIKFDDSDEPISVTKLYKYETNLENAKLCLVSTATNLVNKRILVVNDDTYSMIYKGDANPSGKVRFNVEDYTGYYEESGKYRSRLYMANRFCYPDMNIVQIADREVYHKDWFISAIVNSKSNSIEASFEFLPYYYKLIYSIDNIPKNGLIDLRKITNKPFSLEYYDIYLNGRKLNYSNIIVICDDMIKLKNVNSLRYFRIYEKLPLGDNFDLYPTDENNLDALPNLNSDLMHTDDTYSIFYPDIEIPDTDDNIFDDVDVSLIDSIDIIENVIFKLPIFPDINQLQGKYLTIVESYLEPGTNVYRVNPDAFFKEDGTALINKIYHYNPDTEM